MAKVVWSLIDEELVEHLILGRHTDARLWLIELHESSGQDSFVKTIVTLWSIWWARWKAIHEEEFESPLITFSFIQRFLADLEQIPSKKTNVRSSLAVTSRRWSAPSPGSIKIHVDAAIGRHEDRGAIAAICRDTMVSLWELPLFILQT